MRQYAVMLVHQHAWKQSGDTHVAVAGEEEAHAPISSRVSRQHALLQSPPAVRPAS